MWCCINNLRTISELRSMNYCLCLVLLLNYGLKEKIMSRECLIAQACVQTGHLRSKHLLSRWSFAVLLAPENQSH